MTLVLSNIVPDDNDSALSNIVPDDNDFALSDIVSDDNESVLSDIVPDDNVPCAPHQVPHKTTPSDNHPCFDAVVTPTLNSNIYVVPDTFESVIEISSNQDINNYDSEFPFDDSDRYTTYNPQNADDSDLSSEVPLSSGQKMKSLVKQTKKLAKKTIQHNMMYLICLEYHRICLKCQRGSVKRVLTRG